MPCFTFLAFHCGRRSAAARAGPCGPENFSPTLAALAENFSCRPLPPRPFTGPIHKRQKGKGSGGSHPTQPKGSPKMTDLISTPMDDTDEGGDIAALVGVVHRGGDEIGHFR